MININDSCEDLGFSEEGGGGGGHGTVSVNHQNASGIPSDRQEPLQPPMYLPLDSVLISAHYINIQHDSR